MCQQESRGLSDWKYRLRRDYQGSMPGDSNFDYLESEYQRGGFLVVDYRWHLPGEGDLGMKKSPALCSKCANITKQEEDPYFLVFFS